MAAVCLAVAPVGHAIGALAQVTALVLVLLLALWPSVRDSRDGKVVDHSAEPV